MRSPFLAIATTVALGLACAGVAQAQSAPQAAAQPASLDRQARVWAASCAACHGTGGQSSSGIPPIGQRDADAIYRALLEFKNDQRPAATVMHQHAKGYTDDELRRIAAVFGAGAK